MRLHIDSVEWEKNKNISKPTVTVRAPGVSLCANASPLFIPRLIPIQILTRTRKLSLSGTTAPFVLGTIHALSGTLQKLRTLTKTIS